MKRSHTRLLLYVFLPLFLSMFLYSFHFSIRPSFLPHRKHFLHNASPTSQMLTERPPWLRPVLATVVTEMNTPQWELAACQVEAQALNRERGSLRRQVTARDCFRWRQVPWRERKRAGGWGGAVVKQEGEELRRPEAGGAPMAVRNICRRPKQRSRRPRAWGPSSSNDEERPAGHSQELTIKREATLIKPIILKVGSYSHDTFGPWRPLRCLLGLEVGGGTRSRFAFHRYN